MEKLSAGTGLGKYRRGDVLVDLALVAPGQLIVYESIRFGSVNLCKITETFKDKCYAIFVNPENPAEKSKSSDEEFVVYPTDLKQGEYYIALEPSPEQIGEPTKKAKEPKNIMPKTPTEPTVSEEAGTPMGTPEGAPAVEEPSVEAPVKGSKKTAARQMYTVYVTDAGTERTLTSFNFWGDDEDEQTYEQAKSKVAEIEKDFPNADITWRMEKVGSKKTAGGDHTSTNVGQLEKELEYCGIVGANSDGITDARDTVNVAVIGQQLSNNWVQAYVSVSQQGADYALQDAWDGYQDNEISGMNEEEKASTEKDAAELDKTLEDYVMEAVDGTVYIIPFDSFRKLIETTEAGKKLNEKLSGSLTKDFALADADAKESAEYDAQKKSETEASKKTANYDVWVEELNAQGESVPLTRQEYDGWVKANNGKVPTVQEALAWKGVDDGSTATKKTATITFGSGDVSENEYKSPYEGLRIETTEEPDSATERIIRVFVSNMKKIKGRMDRGDMSDYINKPVAAIMAHSSWKDWTTLSEEDKDKIGVWIYNAMVSAGFDGIQAQECFSSLRKAFGDTSIKPTALDNLITGFGGVEGSPMSAIDSMGKTAIESPVKKQQDYGTGPTSTQERIEKVQSKISNLEASLDKKANDPYVAMEPNFSTEDKLPFANYLEPRDVKADETEEMEPENELETSDPEYEFVYPKDTQESNELEKEFFDDPEAIYINEDEKTAFYADKAIIEVDNIDDMPKEIYEWMEANSYWPAVIIQGERGNQTVVSIVKKGALDNFDAHVEEDIDFNDSFGSHKTLAITYENKVEAASGADGDDGSAYDLAEGRNFTGVNEENIGEVVAEYLDGKATSMASFEDFSGFVEDIYGVPKEVTAEYEDAWVDEDPRRLIACIKDNAVRNLID